MVLASQFQATHAASKHREKKEVLGMGQLSIALLGPPRILHASQLVPFPTRKSEALLIFLAAEGGLHSRDRLTALLWPESDEEHGRGSLRSALASTRESREKREGSKDAPHLCSEQAHVGLVVDPDLELDLHVLREAAELAREANKVLSNETITRLQDALNRYRGDFLQGFLVNAAPDFDEWISQQRESWHRQVGWICKRLSRAYFTGGDLPLAIETAARWVRLDPWSEAAHYHLIQAQAAAGDRTAALRSYQACRAILTAELGIEPSPEIEDLAKHVRRRVTARKVAAETPDSEPELAFPLVGRSSEHTRLVAAYEAACQGKPQLVSVEGEPGIGKTRLVQAFLHWVSTQGADVLQGKAFESSQRFPYQPLMEAFRPALTRWLKQSSLPLTPVWLAELSRWFPELSDYYRDLPVTTRKTGIEARFRLFDAIAHLSEQLAANASGGALVFFVDDAQWMDTASFDLLSYLRRRWSVSHTPILLLVALRPDELAAREAWSHPSELLAQSAGEMPVIRLSLGSLSLQDTGMLLASLFQVEPDRIFSGPARAVCEQLFRDTGGQPFFLVETLRAFYQEQGTASKKSVRGEANNDLEKNVQEFLAWRRKQGIVDVIREAIRARLGRLSATTRKACFTAAVLGDGFELTQLCSVAGLDPLAGLQALDELCERGLIRDMQQPEASTVRFAFTHQWIREVAYAHAGEARRQVLHRRALEELAAAGAPITRLATHALRAGLAAPTFNLGRAIGGAKPRRLAMNSELGYDSHAQQRKENRFDLGDWMRKALPADGDRPAQAARWMSWSQCAFQYWSATERC